ncbi:MULTISPECIES: hypothetical protein [Streptomyces]|uniref:Uncharacterized protein n=1 Tax=Streptomyces gilvifuscus TaxID=1550617 RepID=A0ABT5G7K5_9ACTN|nr:MULTISPECIES: hypothetical protein [Streptomyces]MBK3645336.1 hypothetical protein [Streptomyces sp. MBT33]MDC2960596.1 hypothetical protein [Streptomyces gilvifuscus]
MIKQVSHPGAGTGPAAVTLALEVAYELHAPAGRAPEVAPALVAGRRATAGRSRRRTVRG